MQPVGCDCGQVVQGRAQGLPEEFEAVEHPDGSPHMRRIRPLLSVRCEDAKRLTVTQQFLQQQFFGLPGQEAVTKRAERGEMKAGVSQRQPKEILPVNAGPDGVGGLAIGQRLAKLHNGYERQPPRRQGRLSTRGEERCKVRIGEDGTERIAQGYIQIAMRKGGLGDLGGLLRHRLHGIRAQRHEGRPSAEWVKAPAISGAVLYQSPLPRGTPQLRERSVYIFYYRNILRSKAIEKTSR